MQEVWKEVPGWEGYYEVSTQGRIRRMKNKRLLKPREKSGYLSVGLTRNNRTSWFCLHRLVALAFVPNPGGLPYVNHKDEDKQNNRADNLEWCDAKYNCNYGSRNERISGTKMETQPGRSVQQCDSEWNVIAVYRTQKEAERATGIAQANISSCCRGANHYNSAGGYKWRFV